MKHHHKHLHLARRKMNHIIDEIYTALLRAGGEEVSLRILREAEGLRLFAEGDFLEENRGHMELMSEMLRPAVRSQAMVEEFWELAGGDQYTSDSEMALVGQMADDARVIIHERHVEIELVVSF